jgi:hypothetical protein
MREILAHRVEIDGDEVFNVLSGTKFPSSQHSISSILIHEITSHGNVTGNVNALADLLCNILSAQWNQCLLEEFVCPV